MRRLGIHPEQRVLMCMLDTVDWPDRVPRRDQGGHRAGRREHAAHHERLRIHDCATAVRARLVVSASLLPTFAALLGKLRSSSTSSSRAATSRSAPVARSILLLETASDRFEAADHVRRRLLLALLLGIDGGPEGHDARAFGLS